MIDNFKLVTSNRDALSHQLDVMLSQHDAIEVKARPWSKTAAYLKMHFFTHGWVSLAGSWYQKAASKQRRNGARKP